MAGIWDDKGMKDNNTVQRDERTLEHGLKEKLKLPIFLTCTEGVMFWILNTFCWGMFCWGYPWRARNEGTIGLERGLCFYVI